MSTYLAPDGSWEATARMQQEVIMGEELYTIDVRIVSWAATVKEKEKEKAERFSRFRTLGQGTRDTTKRGQPRNRK
jgi:hypothetical protein